LVRFLALLFNNYFFSVTFSSCNVWKAAALFCCIVLNFTQCAFVRHVLAIWKLCFWCFSLLLSWDIFVVNTLILSPCSDFSITIYFQIYYLLSALIFTFSITIYFQYYNLLSVLLFTFSIIIYFQYYYLLSVLLFTFSITIYFTKPLLKYKSFFLKCSKYCGQGLSSYINLLAPELFFFFNFSTPCI